MLAPQDLKSGTDIIPINALTWNRDRLQLRGGNIQHHDGPLDRLLERSANKAGTQTCVLANSWAYATGTYVTTLNYTLRR